MANQAAKFLLDAMRTAAELPQPEDGTDAPRLEDLTPEQRAAARAEIERQLAELVMSRDVAVDAVGDDPQSPASSARIGTR